VEHVKRRGGDHDRAWKTKRIRNNPRVEVAPSTLRGKPTGEALSARATRLDGKQARIAAAALGRRRRVLQRWIVPIAHRPAGYETLHYELDVDGGDRPLAR
jgi:PPOX class probable F420-dependent enzyme